MEEYVIACEHYSDFHSPKKCPKSLNNSSDTWEAIENAEKLLQEARKKIIESTYDVPWFDLTLNRTSSSNLDESDLNIRQRVITKLQEVNKQKLCEKQILSNRNKKIFLSEHLQNKNNISERKTETNQTYQSSEKVVETCMKCSEEKIGNKLKEKYKLKALNQVNDWKVKTKTITEAVNTGNSKKHSKVQLPVRNVKKSSIISNSCSNLSKKNVKTVRSSTIQNEIFKQKKYDNILIDAAVQTSFKDQVIKENVSSLTDIEQNESEKHTEKNEEHQLEVLNSPKKSQEKQEECQAMMDNNGQVHIQNNDIANINRTSKGSFVKFLCQISHGFEDPVEILPNSSTNLNALQTSDLSESTLWDQEFYDNWDIEEDLKSPNLLHFDEMLYSLDENIEKIIKDTYRLENLFIEAKSYNALDKTADKTKKRKKNNDQPCLLNERSIDLCKQVGFIDKSPKNRINFQKNHEKESSDALKKNKTSDEIKFILEPRSRISSYESVSSEVFHQQARFSTPLNNYRDVKVSHHNDRKKADTNCTNHEKYFTLERKENVDVNIDAINDLNVFITRNQLSSISCGEKNSRLTEEEIIDDRKEKNYDLKSTSVDKSTEKFPCSNFSKDGDTEEHKGSSNSNKYSFSSSHINSNHISIISNDKTNNEVTEISEKHHQEQSEKSLADDKMTKNNHLLIENIKEKGNRENIEDEKNLEINKAEQNKLTPVSSKNDTYNCTSFDISGIYSENFEESITEPESISKEHDTDKSINLLSKKEIKETDEGNIENLIPIQNESEKILSNKVETLDTDLKINAMSPLNSSQEKIDKNPSTKSLKDSFIANKKSVEENHNDLKDKSSLPTLIAHPPSKKSMSSSILNHENTKVHNKVLSSSEDYSEGEIRLPDSCSYSIGEIKIPTSQIEELTHNNEVFFQEILHSSSGSYSPGEIRIPESMINQRKKKNHCQTQSYGEISNTDIDSTSSFESPSEI